MGAEHLEKTSVKKHMMISKKALSSSIVNYVLGEQRLICLFIGIIVSVSALSIINLSPRTIISASVSLDHVSSTPIPRRITYELVDHDQSNRNVNAGGKVPLGLKRKNLRVLVTGGAGFVGSHLVDRLIERGDSVIVVDNFFTDRDHKTNVMGTLNMLGLAKRVGARFLITSTSEVYGDPLQHPQVETYWGNVNPIGVRSCYDEGKRTAETLAMDYHRGLNVEVRIARIFNTYGPRMCIDDGRVVSNFVAQALRKQPLTVYGDGKQTRSFQYVSDLVEGLMRLMEGNHVGPFNLGNPGEFTMLELAKVVQETIDPNAKIEFKPNTEDDPHKRKPDISKAKQLLGWEPTVSLRQGLPRMVDDFRRRIFGDDKLDSGL
ncbi:UDP-glucuronic acid decarboxylase 4-like [Solanum tuberosum]|uniref:UDP-glucuronic acid decarboxylase 4-like n=1 Tax=Solanum tuberosum TaxID=4113 RepID=UPI0003D245CD|nr:PREDICTED: UDP-glucuronic acid decarboxylase 4-like [Solanum tuberosum]